MRPSLSKTHIPILTKGAARINSKIKIPHLFSKEGIHTILMGCHITTHTVHYLSPILFITYMTMHKLSEFLSFFSITIVSVI